MNNKDGIPHFEVPAELRAMTEKNMEQARAAFNAERNVANTFAFADRLVKAKDIQQVIALQTEFAQAQMKELAAQAKELGEAASKFAMKSVPPKS